MIAIVPNCFRQIKSNANEHQYQDQSHIIKKAITGDTGDTGDMQNNQAINIDQTK